MLSNLKNRQKNDGICRKNLIYFLNKNKMELGLPLDELRVNIVLRVLITAYWASGLCSFFSYIPGSSQEDAKLLWYNKNSNYLSRLISSLIFFLLWISQFKYPELAYITMAEIFIIIVAYLYLIICKERYRKKNQENIKRLLKEKREELKKS